MEGQKIVKEIKMETNILPNPGTMFNVMQCVEVQVMRLCMIKYELAGSEEKPEGILEAVGVQSIKDFLTVTPPVINLFAEQVINTSNSIRELLMSDTYEVTYESLFEVTTGNSVIGKFNDSLGNLSRAVYGLKRLTNDLRGNPAVVEADPNDAESFHDYSSLLTEFPITIAGFASELEKSIDGLIDVFYGHPNKTEPCNGYRG